MVPVPPLSERLSADRLMSGKKELTRDELPLHFVHNGFMAFPACPYTKEGQPKRVLDDDQKLNVVYVSVADAIQKMKQSPRSSYQHNVRTPSEQVNFS